MEYSPAFLEGVSHNTSSGTMCRNYPNCFVVCGEGRLHQVLEVQCIDRIQDPDV